MILVLTTIMKDVHLKVSGTGVNNFSCMNSLPHFQDFIMYILFVPILQLKNGSCRK